MKSLIQSFESLETKAEVLLQEHVLLKKELAEMKDSMADIKEQLALREHDLEILKEENRVLKMASSFKGNGDQEVNETKKRINAMVREIDKCLALMND